MGTLLLPVLLLLLLLPLQSTVLNENYCPVTAHFAATEQRYFVVGAGDSPNNGLGNVLAFFPATYFYAALTGRFIVIEDQSYIGQLCTVVRCGFPFFSTIKAAFPQLVSAAGNTEMKVLRHQHFPQSFDSSRTVYNDTFITAAGLDARSNWWVWKDPTRECVAKITGCIVGDVGCAERVAFQSLLVGPFVDAHAMDPILANLVGMPSSMKKAIVSLPRSYAPRIDVTVHLRNQFVFFEMEKDPMHPDSKAELENWLSSPDCEHVFSKMMVEASSRLDHLYRDKPRANPQSPPMAFLYIAADSEGVKRAFKRYVEAQKRSPHYDLRVVTLETGGIYHIKNIDLLKSSSDGQGLRGLALDFYMMSLSNWVFAWRTGGTKGFSTFVSSARKVSGTRERSSLDDGRSIATRAFQLVKSRDYHFEELWVYGVVEST